MDQTTQNNGDGDSEPEDGEILDDMEQEEIVDSPRQSENSGAYPRTRSGRGRYNHGKRKNKRQIRNPRNDYTPPPRHHPSSSGARFGALGRRASDYIKYLQGFSQRNKSISAQRSKNLEDAIDTPDALQSNSRHHADHPKKQKQHQQVTPSMTLRKRKKDKSMLSYPNSASVKGILQMRSGNTSNEGSMRDMDNISADEISDNEDALFPTEDSKNCAKATPEIVTLDTTDTSDEELGIGSTVHLQTNSSEAAAIGINCMENDSDLTDFDLDMVVTASASNPKDSNANTENEDAAHSPSDIPFVVSDNFQEDKLSTDTDVCDPEPVDDYVSGIPENENLEQEQNVDEEKHNLSDEEIDVLELRNKLLADLVNKSDPQHSADSENILNEGDINLELNENNEEEEEALRALVLSTLAANKKVKVIEPGEEVNCKDIGEIKIQIQGTNAVENSSPKRQSSKSQASTHCDSSSRRGSASSRRSSNTSASPRSRTRSPIHVVKLTNRRRSSVEASSRRSRSPRDYGQSRSRERERRRKTPPTRPRSRRRSGSGRAASLSPISTTKRRKEERPKKVVMKERQNAKDKTIDSSAVRDLADNDLRKHLLKNAEAHKKSSKGLSAENSLNLFPLDTDLRQLNHDEVIIRRTVNFVDDGRGNKISSPKTWTEPLSIITPITHSSMFQMDGRSLLGSPLQYSADHLQPAGIPLTSNYSIGLEAGLENQQVGIGEQLVLYPDGVSPMCSTTLPSMSMSTHGDINLPIFPNVGVSSVPAFDITSASYGINFGSDTPETSVVETTLNTQANIPLTCMNYNNLPVQTPATTSIKNLKSSKSKPQTKRKLNNNKLSSTVNSARNATVKLPQVSPIYVKARHNTTPYVTNTDKGFPLSAAKPTPSQKVFKRLIIPVRENDSTSDEGEGNENDTKNSRSEKELGNNFHKSLDELLKRARLAAEQKEIQMQKSEKTAISNAAQHQDFEPSAVPSVINYESEVATKSNDNEHSVSTSAELLHKTDNIVSTANNSSNSKSTKVTAKPKSRVKNSPVKAVGAVTARKNTGACTTKPARIKSSTQDVSNSNPSAALSTSTKPTTTVNHDEILEANGAPQSSLVRVGPKIDDGPDLKASPTNNSVGDQNTPKIVPSSPQDALVPLITKHVPIQPSAISSSKQIIDDLTRKIIESRDQLALSSKERELLQSRQHCFDGLKGIHKNLQNHFRLNNLDLKLQLEITATQKKLEELKAKQLEARSKASAFNAQIKLMSKEVLPSKANCIRLEREVKKLGMKIIGDGQYKVTDLFTKDIEAVIQDISVLHSRQPSNLKVERGVIFHQVISNIDPTSTFATKVAAPSQPMIQAALPTPAKHGLQPKEPRSTTPTAPTKSCATTQSTDGINIIDSRSADIQKNETIKKQQQQQNRTCERKFPYLTKHGAAEETRKPTVKSVCSIAGQFPADDILSNDVNRGQFTKVLPLLELRVFESGIKLDPYKELCSENLMIGICVQPACSFQHI